MERNVIVGGALACAALAGVVGFYLVIAGGSDTVVPEYARQAVEVEALRDRKPGIILASSTEEAETPAPTPTTEAPQAVDADPTMAAKAAEWSEKRREMRERDAQVAHKVFEEFYRTNKLEADKRAEVEKLLNGALQVNTEVKEQIEAGTMNPRVGRKRMAESRQELSDALINSLGKEPVQQLKTTLDKHRLVLL